MITENFTKIALERLRDEINKKAPFQMTNSNLITDTPLFVREAFIEGKGLKIKMSSDDGVEVMESLILTEGNDRFQY